MATEYLDVEDALDAYAEAVEVSAAQASDALLDRGRLESALARPQHAAVYEDADTIRQAATLFWGVAATLAFRDGNKRTAVVLLRAFLNLNGYDFELAEDDLYHLAMASPIQPSPLTPSRPGCVHIPTRCDPGGSDTESVVDAPAMLSRVW